ncbi:MAG: hypothetical protein BJ554DRAFT_1220 [Olpidium bornovanus]|uniref:chitin synthase n=1 Tax=Olpidium bornovanus TaxID=278681 RepID=A0A8H7ZSE3_9FUNG|nr:MAG: hypothetical protein BJ554DRAFT_1220 [Olpidium bornovanus]
MVAIAGFEVYRGVEDAVDKAGQPAVSLRQALLDNGSFTNIVISLGSTYGIYLVASVISLDPWHMLTSFLQYVFFLPSFVNILMVYAFCNIHDVSWGTKGDNATAADLGAAVAKKDQQGDNLVVELELPDEAEDLNQYYDRIVNQELKNRPQAQHKSRDATTKKEDYYKVSPVKPEGRFSRGNSSQKPIKTSPHQKPAFELPDQAHPILDDNQHHPRPGSYP